jgi:NAD(P)H-flavin reductase
MQQFSIGIVAKVYDEFSSKRSPEYALQPRKWTDVTLLAREKLNHDTYRFKFELTDKSKKLGLPIGKHLLLEAAIGGGHLVIRPYTPVAPISDEEDKGVIEMVIKIYRAGANPHFNHGGVLTQYLEKIEMGTSLRVKGPEGHIHYEKPGVITIHGHPIRVTRISMVAGGSGITPMYQLVRGIMNNPKDKTKLSLLISNHTPEDTMLKDEFDKMALENNNFKVWYTVSSADKDWSYDVGRINEQMMRDHLYKARGDTIALVCGPPAMITRSALPLFEKLGYVDNSNLFEF